MTDSKPPIPGVSLQMVSELLSRSETFEPPFRRDGRQALELLGTLAQYADGIFAALAPAVPTRSSVPGQGQARGSSKSMAVTTRNPEYSPALKDPSIVEALFELHAQAFHAVHSPVGSSAFRPAALPEIQSARSGGSSPIFSPLAPGRPRRT